MKQVVIMSETFGLITQVFTLVENLLHNAFSDVNCSCDHPKLQKDI
jgi:hypothetical protein